MSKSQWKISFMLLCLAGLFVSISFGADPEYKKIVVSDKFHSEGAGVGDFNNDGIWDIVSGHFWYEGPDFVKKHQLYEGDDYDPEGYSNSFVIFTDDFNKDGWTDVLICPHPGVTGFWYENPRGEEKLWTPHEATIELGNESQAFTDVDGDGQADLIFNRNNWYGYATYNAEEPNLPWTFHPISPEDPKYQRYFHGNGYGDLNGDGRVDLLEMDGWWEQPEDNNQTPWKFHPFHFADAASNILVYDFDNDGLNDVFTAFHCHLYGLMFYRQVRDADGNIDFVKQVLIPTDPDDNFFPKISQLHSMTLADMNGDGVMDVVTGKRFWAHGSKGDVAANDPAILMWWETVRKADGSVEFVPHIIDEDSGVGTQVTTFDLNEDSVPDIIVGNKKGTFVFLSK